MVLGLNVRPKNKLFIVELARSLAQSGQMQECIGDTLPDGTIRVWAGQHRFEGASLLNEGDPEFDIAPTPFKLRVRAYKDMFSPEKVLEIQLAENLHNYMRPEDEAEGIRKLWETYKQVFADEKKRPSMADLARRIGRSAEKVRAALAFSGIDEDVKSLVERDALAYGVGVELARLPINQQLGVAAKIISLNLPRTKALDLISAMLGEDKGFTKGLFSAEQELLIAQNERRIAMRSAADRAAQDAAGYMARILHLIRILEKRQANDVTPAIYDILGRFVASARRFEIEIEGAAPEIGIVVQTYAGRAERILKGFAQGG